MNVNPDPLQPVFREAAVSRETGTNPQHQLRPNNDLRPAQHGAGLANNVDPAGDSTVWTPIAEEAARATRVLHPDSLQL
ncbi:chromosome partitioning protein, partial [Saccharothrix longispora]|nr:chromosome partitioning protein [Saccharothrix longispora]